MKSPGQVLYGAWLTDQNMAVPWSELTPKEQQDFERIGKTVVDYYAKIMKAEPNVLLERVINRLAELEGLVNDMLQNGTVNYKKVKGRLEALESFEQEVRDETKIKGQWTSKVEGRL